MIKTKEHEREMVRRTVLTLAPYSLPQTLSKLWKTVKFAYETAPDATLEAYDDFAEYWHERPETDEEMAGRIKQEQKWRKESEERELRELARLKDKYEGKRDGDDQ